MAITLDLTKLGVWDKLKKMDKEHFAQYQQEVAKNILRQEQSSGTFPRDKADYLTIVDNSYVKPIEEVKFGGKIEFTTKETLGDILTQIHLWLKQLSPILSGEYIMNHTLLVNGEYVAWDKAVKGLTIGPKDKIQIINGVPYARKIEGNDIYSGGSKKRKPLSSQAPNGVYRVVYSRLRRRYGRNVYIKYTFSRLEGGAIVGATNKRGERIKLDQVYPTLVIRPGRMGTKNG